MANDTSIPSTPPAVLEVSDDLINVRTLLTAQIKALQESSKKSRERSLVITKLQEANFWAGEGASISEAGQR